MPIPGCATEEGTLRFTKRFAGKIPESHFRKRDSLWFSSIGLGTYLGEPDEKTDRLYEEAIVRAVELGCNVLDTAINYRCQRSERAMGQAIQRAISEGRASRSELIVATKGGFIPFDGEYPPDPTRYFAETYLSVGLLKSDDIVAGCHAMSPNYIEDQTERSLRNLNLECIDIYYLHNPETQLQEVSRSEFNERLKATFELLEEFVSRGKIRMYGTATWNGYRTSRTAKDYLSLEELLVLARESAGPEHHFRVLQLPFSLAMPEALVSATQPFGGETLSALEVASKLGMIVMGSASLMQGQLVRGMPKRFLEVFKGARTDAQCSLQFARSSPGMTTALTGMKNRLHVEENLKTAETAPLKEEQFVELFRGVQG